MVQIHFNSERSLTSEKFFGKGNNRHGKIYSAKNREIEGKFFSLMLIYGFVLTITKAAIGK